MSGTAEKLRAATLALLMVTSLFAVAGIGSAADGDPSTYAVSQGGECWDVTAMGDGSQSVEEFYDYRSPETTPSSDSFSSFGTQHFQENQVSQLFVYNGSEGTSLVMVHDKFENGPNASTTTFHISGLPETREWAVEDDNYEGQDDEFNHGDTSSTIHWMWARHRNDGAAVRGLGDTANYSAVEVQPRFNEDAEYWGDWPYSGDEQNKTQAWKLITEPSSSDADSPGNKVELDMSQNVTIQEGSCEDTTSPTADLTAPDTVETGEEFTFDASGSSDDEGIVSYEWDFDGDGTPDATTTDATVNHTYSQNGTYEASVTVYDAAGNSDTANATVQVVDPDDEPPSADLQADPSEAEVGQDEVTFDASGSTDNGEIVEYRWDFDGDGNVDDTTEANTTTHTYSETGEFEATVTVEDAGGNTDTANATVNVSDTTDPVAVADVPDRVVKNTTFEVDASGSTDNGQIDSYEWDFGDGNNATGVNASHSYAENGTYTVTLTVTDTEGNSNTTSAEVTVTDEDTQDPKAKIDARDTANVGEEVTFDGSGSSDDGTIESYEWDIDGTTKTGETVTHSFDSAGTYTVTLEVTDGVGNNDTATHEITIEEKSGDEDQPPKADFTWKSTAKSDKNIEFNASGSTDDDGIVKYEWDHDGDGKYTHKGVKRTIPYDEFGTYEVTLRVTDTSGQVNTTTKTVKVTDETAPTADIDAPDKVEVGEKFTAKAVNIQDESNVTHICWFVDGENVPAEYQPKLQWTFDEPGEHTLRLKVGDEHDNTNKKITKTVKVVEKSSDGGGGGGGGSPGGSSPGGSDDGGDNSDDSDENIKIDLGDARSDEPFTVELPTDSESDSIAAFETITVTLVQSGDYDVTIDTVQEAPEDVTEPTVESDGFEPLSYLVVEQSDLSSEEISDAELTFAIQQSRLDSLDADAENVQIYSYEDGQWSAVDTEVVEETDEEVRFRASGSDLTTVAVAVDRPVVELADLSVSATEIAPGEEVEITATLTNDGQASGVETFDIAVDGETVDEREIHVDANDERSVTVSQTFDEPGTYSISVAGEEVEVVVQSEETEMATETTTDAPATTSTDGQPGFGVVVAVLALLGAALVALRRR